MASVGSPRGAILLHMLVLTRSDRKRRDIYQVVAFPHFVERLEVELRNYFGNNQTFCYLVEILTGLLSGLHKESCWTCAADVGWQSGRRD
jgi:hypothetical protein